jgi:hypothetical protein
MSDMGIIAKDVIDQESITGLLVRYWGIGKKLDPLEKEVLLTALDEENKALQGPTYKRALERLREKGIK